MFLTPDFSGRKDTLELNDYSLSYLKFSNNMVLGNISPEFTEMDYIDFKTRLMEIITTSPPEISESESHFRIFPNPNDGNFMFQCNSNNNTGIKIKIFNSMGQIETQHKIIPVSESQSFTFDISFMPKGIYFLEYISGSFRKTEKIIIK
ncbi:MAG: T9SS type A sorting domain-containing protein [Prolixibacteraceae bacterium]|nr:T9SS type A sorting domain-containing protein [Prolixibacteraceae bacterium]